MGFLKIIEDDETFEYAPVDPTTGVRMDTVFTLRLVPDEKLKDWRRTLTVRTFENHNPVTRVDEMQFAAHLVDYAIVSWSGLRSARDDKELPCTAEMKAKLPETVKADIIRMCGAKEAGAEVAKAVEEKKLSKSTSSGNLKSVITTPAA